MHLSGHKNFAVWRSLENLYDNLNSFMSMHLKAIEIYNLYA